MRAALRHATSPPRENGVRPHFRRHASVLILACAALWGAWVLWHYYAPLVRAIAGPDPILDHPVLFDRWLRPFTYVSEAVARSARALIGAAAVVVASAGVGHVVLANARLEFDTHLERGLFGIGIGLAAVSFLLYGLAGAHVFTPAVVASVVGALATASLAAFVWRRHVLPRISTARAGAPSARSLGFAACAIVALAFALIGALAPETEYDALWYHLWLPQQWLQAGRPVDILQEYVSLYPLTWELLYGAAMTLGGVVAAKLLHWFCLLLLAGAAASLARLVFPRADLALVAALCVTAPTILWEGTTAYVDLPPALFITLSTIALWHYAQRGRRSWLVLAALTMGIALSIKNLALVAAPIAGGAVMIVEWRRSRSLGRVFAAAALFGAIALAPPLPAYARAYAASGNPVFPDLYRVFGARPAERWDDLTERALATFKAHFRQDGSTQGAAAPVRRFVALPWDVTVHGARYGASFGPLFLILIPFAFVRRARPPAALAVACGMAVFLAIWASPLSSLQGRFLVPLVPFAAVLAAGGVEALQDAAGRARHLVAAVLTVLLLINLPPFVRWHEADRRGWEGWLTHVVRALPVAVVTGGESTREYLERKVPSYRAWEFVDLTVPSDATVLTFSGGDHLYSHRRRIWSDATVARPVTWGTSAGRETEALAAARALGITYVLTDKLQAGKTRELAIGSDAMRACCLDRLYEDQRFIVYRIRPR